MYFERDPPVNREVAQRPMPRAMSATVWSGGAPGCGRVASTARAPWHPWMVRSSGRVVPGAARRHRQRIPEKSLSTSMDQHDLALTNPSWIKMANS